MVYVRYRVLNCRSLLKRFCNPRSVVVRRDNQQLPAAAFSLSPLRLHNTNSNPMKKYAVINCEDSPKWDGSEGLLIEPFQKGLFDGHRFLENDEPDGSDTEVWCTFNMPKGDELPSVEDAKQYAGFVITGSHYSATQNDDWVLRLSQWIKDVAEYSASQSGHHPRILAICFGAQVTARALGGEVGKNPSRRMVAKAEEIFPTGSFATKWYSRDNFIRIDGSIKVVPSGRATFSEGRTPTPPKDCSSSNFFRILESHGDCVQSIPPEADLLAYSDTAHHEIYEWKGCVLACQSHPEFTTKVMEEKIYPEERGWLNEKEAAEYRKSLELERHNLPLLKIMWRFLKDSCVDYTAKN